MTQPATKAAPAKLSMEQVLAAVKDVRWLTLDDVGILLEKAAPLQPHEVYRARPAPPTAVNPLAWGYGRMAKDVLDPMCALTMAEWRADPNDPDGDGEYRIVPKARSAAGAARGLDVASAEEVTRPADTNSGISQRALYRHIIDVPGINEDDLLRRLEPMWKGMPELVAYYRMGTGGREVTKILAETSPTEEEAAVATGYGVDPKMWAVISRRAARSKIDAVKYLKAQILSNYLSHISRSGNVDRQVEVRYYIRSERGPKGGDNPRKTNRMKASPGQDPPGSAAG